MPIFPNTPPHDSLWFLPLGGAGEIGMNLALYGTAGKWLMVDCGISFPDDMTPGVEIIMPDIGFIIERRADLVGLVVTHGHEDHLGAIEYLWPQFKCPIYTTAFTAALIRAKWADSYPQTRLPLHQIAPRQPLNLDPFTVEMVPVTHSIPESHMLAITTAHGTVVHTGDWKLDPDPVVGCLTDVARLQELGDAGVVAVVGDSTCAHVAGHSGSERTVQKALHDVFAAYDKRIVVACFSSNVARLKSIALAASAHGRHVGLVGRSLIRNTEIAQSLGYLPEVASFLDAEDAMALPRDKVVLIATGCQGENRAALTRLAEGTHRFAHLDAGDTVIFSSRDIPGNEKAIARVQNRLLQRGIGVLTRAIAPDIHVSGHPSQDELTQLYQWLRPQAVIPVHGELRHQTMHAHVAEACQACTLIPHNGQIVTLAATPEIVGEVPSGRLGLDGLVLRKLDKGTFKHRVRLGQSGVVVATVLLDRADRLVGKPSITLIGVEDAADTQPLVRLLEDAGVQSLAPILKRRMGGKVGGRGRGSGAKGNDEDALVQTLRSAFRRVLRETLGKEPVIEVKVIRVG